MYYSINFNCHEVSYSTVVKADNAKKASEILCNYWNKLGFFIEIENISEYHLLTNS